MTLLAYKDKSIGYSLYGKSAGSGISIDNKVDVTLTIEVNPEDTPSSNNKVKVIGTMQIGDIVKTYKGGSQFANNFIYLFSGGSSVSSHSWNFVGKIFKCKITELNGEVLGHFIPALRKSDSKPGMYDLVSGQFFTNQGTGEFSYGYKQDYIELINTIFESIITGEELDNMDNLLSQISQSQENMTSLNTQLETIING